MFMLLCERMVRPLRWGLAVAVILLCVSGPLPPPASAAGSRPTFQIPFRCAEKWKATTRSGHRAVDWNFGVGSDDLGMPVTAAAPGEASTTYHRQYGYYIDIDHGGGWVTRYAHLLSRGRRTGPVAQGEVIGYVGSTGSSTAPHLHWEQRADDVPQTVLIADHDAIKADGRQYTSRNCLRRDPYLTGDIDGDGVEDMATRFVHGDGSSTVKVIAGASTRELKSRPGLSLTADVMPSTALLTLGDTNGDGRADLNGAYRHKGGVRFVSFYGRSDTTFGARRVRYFNADWNFRRLQSVRAADVDGDGVADLTARFVRADGSSIMRVIPGGKQRELTRQRKDSISAKALPRTAKVAMGDTNGDGRADLNALVPAGEGVRFVSFYGRADATFGGPKVRATKDTWRFRKVKALRTADVDDDGVHDFVLRVVGSDGSSVLRTLRGRSGRVLARFAATSYTPEQLPARAFVAVGDTNGDGRADVNAAYGSDGGVRFASYYGTATRRFSDRRVRFYGSDWEFHRLC